MNTWQTLTPEAAYDAGYRLKSDRRGRFPWNADMEEVLSLSPPQAIEFLRRKFANYEGLYARVAWRPLKRAAAARSCC